MFFFFFFLFFFFFFFVVVFFNSALHPFQDYFSSYETGQSVGGAKTGEPREKTHGTPASRTWLVPHVASAGLEHKRHSGEMFERLRNGTLNCSATGAATMLNVLWVLMSQLAIHLSYWKKATAPWVLPSTVGG